LGKKKPAELPTYQTIADKISLKDVIDYGEIFSHDRVFCVFNDLVTSGGRLQLFGHLVCRNCYCKSRGVTLHCVKEAHRMYVDANVLKERLLSRQNLCDKETPVLSSRASAKMEAFCGLFST